jgi:hypothetical protein
LKRATPPPFVPTQSAPLLSSSSACTKSFGSPSLRDHVSNRPSRMRASPPPDVPIHSAPSGLASTVFATSAGSPSRTP